MKRLTEAEVEEQLAGEGWDCYPEVELYDGRADDHHYSSIGGARQGILRQLTLAPPPRAPVE